MVENVSQVGPPGTGDYAVADNGTLVYFLGGGQQGTTLAWADRTGTTKVIGGQARQNWGTGRLAPSGAFVANGITDGKGVRDVWTFDVERGTLTRLTFGSANDAADFPIWSPDSKTVYYSGVVGGKTGVFAVPADASTVIRSERVVTAMNALSHTYDRVIGDSQLEARYYLGEVAGDGLGSRRPRCVGQLFGRRLRGNDRNVLGLHVGRRSERFASRRLGCESSNFTVVQNQLGIG